MFARPPRRVNINNNEWSREQTSRHDVCSNGGLVLNDNFKAVFGALIMESNHALIIWKFQSRSVGCAEMVLSYSVVVYAYVLPRGAFKETVFCHLSRV